VKGAVAAARRRLTGGPAPLPWQLHALPVCASTELELDRLLSAGATAPVAVLARRQTRGHGQQGRPWCSPAGGVWLSAALPWPEQPQGTASLALAVAVGLALELEQLGLQPRIKWPNDLLLNGRKLAGVLPRLRWRGGRILGARVGLGINGRNPVPRVGINLAEALAVALPGLHHPEAQPQRLAGRVLRALEWASAQACQPERVRLEAERRLWRIGTIEHGGLQWQPLGLHVDGSLLLQRGEQRACLQRSF
jgi:BirA family biotin operon repressor/biotin-[acetyl-CoA-carboxylase] ligase